MGLFGGGRKQKPGGWSVISSNPGKYGQRQTSRQTSRSECVPPVDVEQIRLEFGNWYTDGVGENTNTNPIKVRASIQYQGSTIDENNGDGAFRVTFGGKDYVVIGRGARCISDPLPTAFTKNQRFFIKTYVDATMPAAPSSASPSATSGGSLAAGTYGVSLTIVYPDGIESAASVSTAQVLTAGQSIIVSSPAPVVGAIGYRAWITAPNGSLTGNHYDTGAGVIPFGSSFTYTQSPLTSSYNSLEQVDPNGALYIPIGVAVLGGVNPGTSNNGEAKFDGVDRTGELRAVRGTQGGAGVYLPCAVLGFNSKRIIPSCAVIGDSIATATADNGFGYSRGGFMVRTLMNQLLTPAYDASIPPLAGHVLLSQGSERAAQFQGTAGFKRSLVAFNCTHVWSNYGTNDFAVSAATIITYYLTIARRFINAGKIFIQSDIISRPTSTDGWVTLENQRIVSSSGEAHRRLVNNWISSNLGEVIKFDFPMFRGFGSPVAPSYDVYGGGTGAITTFYAQDVFKQGSETIKVNGAVKVLTTDYTYLGGQLIDGVLYATGVVFVVAPANGFSVTSSYTSIKGMRAMLGQRSKYMPTAISVSIDANGTPDKNGAFFKLSDPVPLVGPRAATSMSVNGLDDTTQSWTQDQFRGYCVMITADAVTPASVGQVICIQYNTATTIRSNTTWTVTPSANATYKIFKCYQTDSVHPSTFGHIEMAKASDLSLLGIK